MQSGECVVTYWAMEGYTVIHFLKKKKWKNIQSEYIQHMVEEAHQVCEQQSAWQQLGTPTAPTAANAV
jgi:hypothetical protein